MSLSSGEFSNKMNPLKTGIESPLQRQRRKLCLRANKVSPLKTGIEGYLECYD
jgi:hypothetical protein